MRLPVLAAPVIAAVLAPCADAAGQATTASDRCPNADAAPGQASVQALQAGTLCLVDAERAARGLQPLRAQHALAQAAGSFARQMDALKLFDPTSPSGSTVLSFVCSSGYMRRAAKWRLGVGAARLTRGRSPRPVRRPPRCPAGGGPPRSSP